MILASALVLSACGSKGGQQTVEPVTSEAAGVAESIASADTQPVEGTDVTSEAKAVSFSGTGTIEDTVLVDEKDVRIMADNLTYSAYQSTMDLLIENNSDQDLSVISGSIGYSCNAVNGYTVSSMYVNENVSAGMKVNTSISISNEELEALGITDIAELEIGFQVKTSDYQDYLTTGPVKIETSAAASYDLSEDTYQKAISDGTFEAVSGKKITAFQTGVYFSSSGIRLVSAGLVNSGDTKAALLELENTGDQVLYFCIGDLAVNNLVLSSPNWDSMELNPGGRGVMAISIDQMADAQEQEAFRIGEISEIAFHASICDIDNNTIAKDMEVSIAFGEDTMAVDDSGDEIYNENGIRIISKGASDDMLYHYVLLTIINDSPAVIYVSDAIGTASVNGFMVDDSTYSRTLEPGQAGAMKYGISKSSLEDNKIGTDDITTVSFQLNIGSGSFYNYIDQPKLTISYN